MPHGLVRNGDYIAGGHLDLTNTPTHEECWVEGIHAQHGVLHITRAICALPIGRMDLGHRADGASSPGRCSYTYESSSTWLGCVTFKTKVRTPSRGMTPLETKLATLQHRGDRKERTDRRLAIGYGPPDPMPGGASSGLPGLCLSRDLSLPKKTGQRATFLVILVEFVR